MNSTSGRSLILKIKEPEINNLYRLSPKYSIESKQSIYLPSFLRKKKFAHILLKELFFILKPGGKLRIDYFVTNEIDLDGMEKMLWWLFRGNYIITSHSKSGRKNHLTLQKISSQFNREDGIDKWTFGIITNGDRNDWMDEIILSIRNLKIPHYEIIVCGKYMDRNEKDFTYINFNERAERGWITKKKNLICQKAKYNNLCIFHDRLVFDKDWYKGMKKYGNAFELLGCKQLEKHGSRAGDWLSLGGPIPTHYKVSQLKDTDWNWYSYLSGQLMIIKKNIWEKILWDETRYWNEAEDADISYRSRDAGFIARYNPYSLCTALTWRHGALPLKYDIRDGLFPKDMIKRRLMRLTARVIYRIPFAKQLMLTSYGKISKTKLYRYFIYH